MWSDLPHWRVSARPEDVASDLYTSRLLRRNSPYHSRVLAYPTNSLWGICQERYSLTAGHQVLEVRHGAFGTWLTASSPHSPEPTSCVKRPTTLAHKIRTSVLVGARQANLRHLNVPASLPLRSNYPGSVGCGDQWSDAGAHALHLGARRARKSMSDQARPRMSRRNPAARATKVRRTGSIC
jgi:hypothetical protein